MFPAEVAKIAAGHPLLRLISGSIGIPAGKLTVLKLAIRNS